MLLGVLVRWLGGCCALWHSLLRGNTFLAGSASVLAGGYCVLGYPLLSVITPALLGVLV